MAGSSGFHWARAAYRSGMLSRRRMAGDVWQNIQFRLKGSTDEGTERVKDRVEHFFVLCVIGLLGWLLITLVQVIATLIRTRYSIALEDNLHARRIHTQTEVLERLFIGCIVVISIAAMLIRLCIFSSSPTCRPPKTASG